MKDDTRFMDLSWFSAEMTERNNIPYEILERNHADRSYSCKFVESLYSAPVPAILHDNNVRRMPGKCNSIAITQLQ